MELYPIRLIRLVEIAEPSHRLRESIDVERLGALADSLAAEGLHQPIGVREVGGALAYEIVWGHRRFLAASLLRWTHIHAKVFPEAFDPLLAACTENNNREELTPMDEARALHKFVERGEPLSAIARLWRRTATWCAQRLELLDLASDLQDALHDRELSLSVARALGAIDHAPYRASLIAEAKRTGATARTVEVWAAHYLADRERIIQNHLAIDEIVRNRDQWKIMVPCELCEELCDYPDTRTLRACHGCMTALAVVIEAQGRAARAAEPPEHSTADE
jgi:ParB/RepB/Spo0J family partition protein